MLPVIFLLLAPEASLFVNLMVEAHERFNGRELLTFSAGLHSGVLLVGPMASVGQGEVLGYLILMVCRGTSLSSDSLVRIMVGVWDITTLAT